MSEKNGVKILKVKQTDKEQKVPLIFKLLYRDLISQAFKQQLLISDKPAEDIAFLCKGMDQLGLKYVTNGRDIIRFEKATLYVVHYRSLKERTSGMRVEICYVSHHAKITIQELQHLGARSEATVI